MRPLFLVLVVITFVVAGPVLTLLTFEAHIGEVYLPSLVALLVMLSAASALIMGLRSLWLRRVAGKPSDLDQLPTETAFAVFILPLTTSVSGTLLTFAAALIGLTPHRPFMTTTHVIAIQLAVGAIAVSALIPFGAQRLVACEREGEHAALFDKTATPEAVQKTIERRWRALRGFGRHWLAEQRVTALGAEGDRAPKAWPRPGQEPSSLAPWLSRVFKGALVVLALSVIVIAYTLTVDGLGAESAPTIPNMFQRIALVVGLAALPSIAVWLYAYAVLQHEQGEADLLRLAQKTLDKRIKESREPELDSNAGADRLAGYTRVELVVAAIKRDGRPVR